MIVLLILLAFIVYFAVSHVCCHKRFIQGTHRHGGTCTPGDKLLCTQRRTLAKSVSTLQIKEWCFQYLLGRLSHSCMKRIMVIHSPASMGYSVLRATSREGLRA